MTEPNTPARFRLALVALTGLITACAATPPAQPSPVPDTPPSTPTGTDTQTPPTTVSLPPFDRSGNADMDAWRDDFARRSVAAGRDPMVVHATLAPITPLALYLGDEVTTAKVGIADQAEFAKPIWDYVRSAVTTSRKTNGAAKLVELDEVFDRIENVFGVDREAVTAIWAMETNLGSYIGNFDAANTLANMAVEGRRRSYAESELTILMKLQERGDVTRDQLISGWAGAMGQTQFMPSTFMTYAVDFDGDGRKDIWNSAPDALASAANYLSASGYVPDQPWGIEVRAPEGFDWSLADGQDRRMSTWTAQGLSAISGRGFPVDESTYAEFWLPAGATGPKYLLFNNFNVYKTYNRSDSYALAVGLLTDGVGGQDGPVETWPTDLQPLSVRDVMTLQDALNRLGYEAGPVDGIAGRGTKGALRSFQKDHGHLADGYPTAQALAQVLAAS